IPEQVLSGRAIFEQNRLALYVMGYKVDNRIGGCCSAFAVAPDLLATNAHCVRDCRARGGTPIVTQNDSMGKARLRIVAMSAHPAYKPGQAGAGSPDVALLRIDGRASHTVKLANDAELRAIGPGDDAYVLGFPGRLMDPLSPSATFLEGRIGRVTGIDDEATTPDRAVVIQHDAVTRGGNSGSPIFNQYGHVIGIHAAHIDDEDDVTIDGRKTTVTQSSPFRIGMRIDLLKGVPAP
ncbi:glutamyl endopeptidase, partial [Sorangium cellulosum]